MPIRLRPQSSAKARRSGGAEAGSAAHSPWTNRIMGRTTSLTAAGSSPRGPSNQSSNGKNQNIQSETSWAPRPRASGCAYPASRSNRGASSRRTSSSVVTIPSAVAHRRLFRRISSTPGFSRAGHGMVKCGPSLSGAARGPSKLEDATAGEVMANATRAPEVPSPLGRPGTRLWGTDTEQPSCRSWDTSAGVCTREPSPPGGAKGAACTQQVRGDGTPTDGPRRTNNSIG